MTDKISNLKNTAKEFGRIAKKVNLSSIERKKCAEILLSKINESHTIGGELMASLSFVAETNYSWKNQDNEILSLCHILFSNIEKQKYLLNVLEDSEMIDQPSIDNIRKILFGLSESIKQIEANVLNAIGREFDIILLDRLILERKKYQQNAISTLKKLTMSIIDDSENAIAGSAANLKRGDELTETIMNITEENITKNKEALEKMILDAYNSWNISIEVNNNSKSQYDFDKHVKNYMEIFYEDSNSIKELVSTKHKMFEENLQIITVYTVLLSMDFKKYSAVEDLLKNISYPENIRDTMNEMIILADLACEDIRHAAKMNLDSTEICHLNNEIETKALEMSDQEIALFKEINDVVSAMTEFTAYPVEGSEQNIHNGKQIEMLLKDISGITNVDYNVIKKDEPAMKTGKTVFVIDDSSAIRMVVKKVLESEDYNVMEAADGAIALNMLDGRKIDLMICDVNMPNKNGIEFLESVKGDSLYAAYRYTPIVMLTTEAGESIKEKGKELGAKAWMVKPFQPDYLLDKIKPLLG